MSSPRFSRRGMVALLVPLSVLLLMVTLVNADAGDDGVLNCEGVFEGYVVEDEGSSCYSRGFWRLSFEPDSGFFNFHFHGWTEDELCFGIKDKFSGCPLWVQDLLCSDCGLCVESAETRIQVNQRGRVLVTCHGFAFSCVCHDTEPPAIVSATAPDSTTVLVTFSEAMSEESVENVSNYYFIPALTVLSATRDETEWNKVWLKTSPQTPEQFYKVTIYSAQDLAGNDLAYPNFAYFSGGPN